MRRFLIGLINLTCWPAVLVFLLAGCAAVCFAFVSVNLFTQAMANWRFLREFGWTAVEFGALWQVGQLLVWGSAALSCWLVFKICEQELEDRYLTWARKARDAPTKPATDPDAAKPAPKDREA